VLGERFTTSRPQWLYPALDGKPQINDLFGPTCGGVTVQVPIGTLLEAIGGWIDRFLVKTVNLPELHGWFDRDQLEKV
jgi:hypothetical protein